MVLTGGRKNHACSSYPPPGTGKTWLAQQLSRFITKDRSTLSEFVQFHPSYTYEAFIEGLRPVTENGFVTFKAIPGLVIEVVKRIEAEGLLNDPTADFVVVMDEANRANLPRVLGELMYLFEYRNYSVRLPYSGDFSLPRNLRFIATMNTADGSIRSIDVALRRRFEVFELLPDPKILGRHYQATNVNEVGNLIDGFEQLNQALESALDRHHTIGHSFFMRKKIDSGELVRIWQRRIFPLIEEYFFDQPETAKTFSLERFWPGVAR